MKKITPTTTATHADLLARFIPADAQAIKNLAKQKKISIAKAIAQHERAAPAPVETAQVEVTKIPTGMTAKKAAAAKAAAEKAAKKSTEKFTAGRDLKMVKGRGIDAKIKLLVATYPRKPDTDAARHWALMKDGISVREYLANFAPGIDARRARQWLFNHQRSGFVALDETPEA